MKILTKDSTGKVQQWDVSSGASESFGALSFCLLDLACAFLYSALVHVILISR